MRRIVVAAALMGAVFIPSVAAADPPTGNFGQCASGLAQFGIPPGTELAPGRNDVGPSVVWVVIDFSTNPPTFTARVVGPGANSSAGDGVLIACGPIPGG